MSGSGRRTVRSRVRSLSEADADSLQERRPALNRHRERSKYGSSIPLFRSANLRVVLGICFLAFFVILFMIHHLLLAEPKLPRAVTPLPAPKIMDLPQFQGEHKESLYWGTYRPHAYFGIRARISLFSAFDKESKRSHFFFFGFLVGWLWWWWWCLCFRTPKSLIAGLMWIGVKDGRYHLRHVCRHEDDLSTYGWTRHNGRDFGHQVLVDHGMTLTTGFLKSKSEGSGYGGDWAVRINVQLDKSKWNEEFGRGAQLFFYLADEAGNALDVSGENMNIHEDSLLASGSRADIGDWQLHLKSMDNLEMHYAGFHTPHFHNLSDFIEENLASQIRKHARLELSDSLDDSPNVLVFQIIGGFPFTTDIALISGTDSDSSRIEERVSMLTGISLSNQLKYKEQEFDEKFEKIFHLAEKVDSESISVGKAAVGNLLGGIGYFYGQSKIAVSRILNVNLYKFMVCQYYKMLYHKYLTGGHVTHNWRQILIMCVHLQLINYINGQNPKLVFQRLMLRERVNYLPYWPAELYTSVPSRSFFPRGFLWDEGFHQLIIWRWDIHISLDIIGHWLDLMNVDGWIPREQILGAEALSRVPEEFVPQHPTNGNPPTLFLALNDIINSLKNNEFTAMDRSEISQFLERAFVRLEAWFHWFNTTQSGKQMSSYYWHGRDNRTTVELNPKVLICILSILLTSLSTYLQFQSELYRILAVSCYLIYYPRIGLNVTVVSVCWSIMTKLTLSLVITLAPKKHYFCHCQTLSSGLDDYPRASHPSADERHLDLRCWMLLAADCMHSIQELLDKESKPGMNYGSTAKSLSDFELLNQSQFDATITVSMPNLFLLSIQLHFDDALGAYFDFGNHTEKVQLKWKELEAEHNYAARQLVRHVLERPVLRLVPHIGYVSLFPFMGRIIPSGSWILEKQLELISNRSLLWTNYGLRSLAKTSSLYMKRNTEHDPPYWRGPVWINMNYRILSALHHYSKENGPYQAKAKAIYEELRSNLIRNIVRNYQESGFLWEQYDQTKGKGKGAHPFTGWTSLVVLIMAETYGKI
uniref:Mannosyl-oligosaccharide glucosidase n=1 Tax=Cajanus cajan TaxID=3821 RepID=A0A151SDP6_CAJCA|nr:putative mannosyl-oligosaccharide glucosidase [Cajanus cajan]